MPPSTRPQLKKSLRLSDGIALLIGITIGSGIYTTPSIIAGYFDSYQEVMIAWLAVGGFVMIGGLIYAELGTRLPTTGGEYVYITTCFGPWAGFMFGWAQLIIIRTSPAAGLSIIAADYTGYFVDLGPTGHTTVALGYLALLGVINYVGIYWASLFQKVSTTIKVGALVVFALAGAILLGNLPNLLGTTVPSQSGLGPTGSLIAALMLIVFTHAGWDRVGYVAGEMKNPREVIPRTMVIGMAIILVLYWSIISIYHYALGVEGMRATSTPAADVAALMVGSVGAGVVAILAIISALGSINGTMMSSSRVYYAMARDGLFFKSLNFVHPTFRTPSRAILVHCLWAAVILLFRGSFETIVTGMVFAILIFYTLTTFALFKMRREHIGEENAFKVPLYPLLPAIYLVGIVGLLVFRFVFEWENSLIDLLFIASGLPISLFWIRKKKNAPDNGRKK
jgi:basic amino acid/polyamine antiporter, APA family